MRWQICTRVTSWFLKDMSTRIACWLPLALATSVASWILINLKTNVVSGIFKNLDTNAARWTPLSLATRVATWSPLFLGTSVATLVSTAMTKLSKWRLQWACMSLVLLAVPGESLRPDSSCPQPQTQHGVNPSMYNCQCTDGETPTAECVGRDLDDVPHDLDPQLHRLDLSYNRIKVLSHSISFYPDLVSLAITQNNLTRIEDNCFADNRKLQVLDLSWNMLSSLSKASLTGLVNLVSLDLRFNKISTVQAGAFQGLKKITSLELSHNILVELDTQIFLGDIGGSLQSLNIAHNHLKYFPTQALSRLSNLRTLDVGHNTLQLENPVFSGLPLLTSLSLRECNIKIIGDDAFLGLTLLETLDISHNGLHTVPARGFRHLSALEILDIGGNYIQALGDKDLNPLRRLRDLRMSDCKGEVLVLSPGVFSWNTELVSITLSKCHLGNIEPSVTLDYLPMLKTLDLRGNTMKTLHRSFVPFSDLLSLDITDCPLVCDCSIQWLRNLLQNNPLLAKDARCLYGREYNRILNFDEQVFSCEKNNQLLLVVCIVGGIVLALSLLSAFLVLIWRKSSWCGCVVSRYYRITGRGQRRANRKVLSANFTGKDDIKVLQNNIANNGRFIELPGLIQESYTDEENNEHIYEQVSECLGPFIGPDVKTTEV